MSFPADPITLLGELALGADRTADPGTWSWTDVTSYLYTRDGLQIGRGRADQANLADTSKLAVTADNRDGRWSSRNPTGAWFGQLRSGTPIRIKAEGHVRYAGFLSELPPRWDVSGRDRYAPLAAQGLLYELTQGESPARSAVARTVLGKSAPTPLAYWSLEDDSSATFAASGLSGGAPLQVSGTAPIFGAQGLGAGVAAGVDLAEGGKLVGTIRPSAATKWSLSLVAQYAAIGPPVSEVLLHFLGGRWETYVSTSLDSLTISYYVAGVSVGSLTSGIIDDDTTHHIVVTTQQSGTGASIALVIDGVTVDSDTIASVTVTVPTDVVVNPVGDASDAGPLISHLAVYDEVYSDSLVDAITGYLGEQAHTRFLRLSDEEGIPAVCDADLSQEMGPQLVDSYLPLVRECEASDQGYLFENLEFGLTLQGHRERENLTAAVELDYEAAGHVSPPLEPTDDNRDALNDVEVKRDGGSSSRLVEEDPDVELSIPNIGRRDDSKTYSLYLDEQTYQVAGWRLHMGTFPGYRFPTLTINLAAGPGLIADVCAADVAYRLTIDNPPDDIGPDLVDLTVEGYSETIGPFDWLIGNNCSLYGPWHVGELAQTSADAGAFLLRLAEDKPALRIAVDSDDTSFVFDPNAFRWTTTADDFDPDPGIRVGGEVVTVSTIATTAATFVAAGTAAHANNASVTPALPAGVAANDLLLVFAAIRNSGSGIPAAPTGYTRLPIFADSANAQVFAKVHSGSESDPTVTFTGGVANADTSAQMAAFRNMPITLSDLADVVLSATTQLNSSAQDILVPYLAVTPYAGQVVLAFGWKQDDWTSVTSPTGFTEIGEPDTTTGDDQGITWGYRIDTTAAMVANGLSFAVTGGATAISRSAVAALAGGYQTMTVSARSTNGVVKSHAVGAILAADQPGVLGL